MSALSYQDAKSEGTPVINPQDAKEQLTYYGRAIGAAWSHLVDLNDQRRLELATTLGRVIWLHSSHRDRWGEEGEEAFEAQFRTAFVSGWETAKMLYPG